MKRKANTLYSDQRGMVSIIVTMILIIVMTLVVLAMAQDSNREQRQVLDRQLSEQAFYNAESGINDWSNYIYQTVLSPGAQATNLPLDKKECDPKQNGYGQTPDPLIDGVDGVNSYTCVLYDRAPITLRYNNVKPHEAVVIPLEPAENPLRHLAFEWSPASIDASLAGCNLTDTSVLPSALPENCNNGGLRIDIVKSTGSRDEIANSSFVVYMVPSSSAATGNINYSQANNDSSKGKIVAANCSDETKICKAVIDINSSFPVGSRHYLRFSSFYNPVDLSLYGCNAALNADACADDKTNGSQRTRFASAQIELDVTGKANDVLRRLQVRIPAEAGAFDIGADPVRSSQAVRKCSVVSAVNNTATDPTGNCSP